MVEVGSSTSTTSVEHDAFYGALTERNRGLISPSQQGAIRRSTILIAGCGSTGGAVIEPLVRMGAECLLLADNGSFELNNLNRQHADHSDVTVNKAEVAARRAKAINPYLDVTVERAGITPGTVADLVTRSKLIIDGVDVTENRGWKAKLQLHQTAAQCRKPLITGYDMAGVQYVRFYDYRRPGGRAFDGRITDRHLETMTTWRLLMRIVGLRRVPVEMIEELRAHLGDQDYSVPQLTYAGLLFGAMASRMSVEVLSGGRVRREVVVDAHQLVRSGRGRVNTRLRRLRELISATGDIARVRRGLV
jgi:hypothetical protein